MSAGLSVFFKNCFIDILRCVSYCFNGYHQCRYYGTLSGYVSVSSLSCKSRPLSVFHPDVSSSECIQNNFPKTLPCWECKWLQVVWEWLSLVTCTVIAETKLFFCYGLCQVCRDASKPLIFSIKWTPKHAGWSQNSSVYMWASNSEHNSCARTFFLMPNPVWLCRSLGHYVSIHL